MTLITLTFAAFMTACLSAAIGLGGGVVLMLVMPGLIPLGSVLPLHAVVQTVSNAARAAFFWREVSWRLMPALLAGALLGAALGGYAVSWISLTLLPAVSGVLVLLVTWWPRGMPLWASRYSLVALGFWQTSIGMLAGATGPLGAAVLSRLCTTREWIVVNTGVYMAINHATRTAAYGVLGFSLTPWWREILVMSVATLLGAWIGGRLRQRLPERHFTQIFRWLVTLLALRMVFLTMTN